jgi:hypothetical protein
VGPSSHLSLDLRRMGGTSVIDRLAPDDELFVQAPLAGGVG